LRRLIQSTVEDKLSDAVLSGRFSAGDTVLVDVDEEEIVLEPGEPILNTDDQEEGQLEEPLPTG
jgi:hypothetical protein